MNEVGFYARRAWFERFRADVLDGRRERPAYALDHTCPCCGYPTLLDRGLYGVCQVCWWEDLGVDDDEGSDDHGETYRCYAPNNVSLAKARENFEEYLHYCHRGAWIPGMDDAEATENKRRAVEAFDAMLDAASAEEINALFEVVDGCMAANDMALRKHLDGGWSAS